jgi:hypothetical protein
MALYQVWSREDEEVVHSTGTEPRARLRLFFFGIGMFFLENRM